MSKKCAFFENGGRFLRFAGFTHGLANKGVRAEPLPFLDRGRVLQVCFLGQGGRFRLLGCHNGDVFLAPPPGLLRVTVPVGCYA